MIFFVFLIIYWTSFANSKFSSNGNVTLSTTSTLAFNQARQNIPIINSCNNVGRFQMDSTNPSGPTHIPIQLKRGVQSLSSSHQNFLLQKSTPAASNQQSLIDNMRNSRLVHKQIVNNSAAIGYYDSFGVTINQPNKVQPAHNFNKNVNLWAFFLFFNKLIKSLKFFVLTEKGWELDQAWIFLIERWAIIRWVIWMQILLIQWWSLILTHKWYVLNIEYRHLSLEVMHFEFNFLNFLKEFREKSHFF